MLNTHFEEVKAILDEKYAFYNQPLFIETDPICIPHRFSTKEDIEISGFLTATLAWGQRKTIIHNSIKLMEFMGNSPFQFVMDAGKLEMDQLSRFVHRTFNGDDLLFLIGSFREIYLHHGGMEAVVRSGIKPGSMDISGGLIHLRKILLETPHLKRSEKHIANVQANSSAKRLNMFLRWMVRKDDAGVDFGIWDISPSLLLCPLDVHSGRSARSLGLLERNADDFKSVIELTNALRRFDPQDPVKYDFALFGMGIGENLRLI